MPRPRSQQPRFYFSFRSPYSWLAYRDLVRAHADVAARLVWRPFWEPDAWSRELLAAAGGTFPYTPMSRAKHLYILGDVRRLAAARGLSPSWPVDRDPCWEVSHLAYLVAARDGVGPAFVDRVYRARWERGQDVNDRATVAAVAADLGLDPDRVAGAADDPAVRAEGVAALLAVERDGVFGVPFFVHDHDRYWGVDRLAAFVAAVRAGQPAPRGSDGEAVATAPAVPEYASAFDGGHAGGCG